MSKQKKDINISVLGMLVIIIVSIIIGISGIVIFSLLKEIYLLAKIFGILYSIANIVLSIMNLYILVNNFLIENKKKISEVYKDKITSKEYFFQIPLTISVIAIINLLFIIISLIF